jgi:hypothetical protein
MQPAQQDCQRIVIKCQAGRDEMRSVAVLLVFVYCFLIETVRTRVCLELQGRKECNLNVLPTLTVRQCIRVTCFWPRGMSPLLYATCVYRRALFVCPACTSTYNICSVRSISVVVSITDRYSPVIVFLFHIPQIAGLNIGLEAVYPILCLSQVFLRPNFSTYSGTRL